MGFLFSLKQRIDMHNFEDIDPKRSHGLGRRSFLRATGIIATSTVTGGLSLPAIAQQGGAASAERLVNGRRKLGQLEVSSVGLGCQDMTGTFYATAPRRPDMIALVRAAHDRGVTLFDAAEAYGPLEVERILGEAVAPFRNQVAIPRSLAGTSTWKRAGWWAASIAALTTYA